MSRTSQNGFELSAVEKRALLADLLRQQAARARTPPLSFAQQRLWFLDQLEPDNPFYNLPQAIRLTGVLNAGALEQTIHAIIARHESLRTTFKSIDGTPAQVITESAPAEMPLTDLTNLPESERGAEARRLATEEAQRPFDLAQGPLFRANLLRLAEEDHVLLLTMHHIVGDGWSAGILFRELATLYEAFSAGNPSPLPELPIQYADFAVWQREWLQGEVLEKQLSYWKERLGGELPVLELPTDRARPAVQTYLGSRHTIALPKHLVEQLKQLSQREEATLYMLLLAAFQVLLYRYSGQEDIAIGSPIAGRNREETEGLIGFFVNTLVMRTDLTGNPTFLELLERVREVALDAYAHQDLPFEKLVEELQPERSLSYSPLFQVMFALQNAPRQALELGGLALSYFSYENKTAIFDLEVHLWEKADSLTCSFVYNTDLFDGTTITRMAEQFKILLEGIVADPESRLSELPLLTEAAQEQILVEWNDTQTDYPREKTIHQLFEEQVRRTPDAVAVVLNDEQLTYQELNERANQLANYLQRMGVEPEVMVAISMERSLEMVVGLLGILKAGGTYVPLDPDYPEERLSFILEDTKTPIVLTQAGLKMNLPATAAELLLLDSGWEAIARESEQNLAAGMFSENTAYVIYTSGSTGQPKGVLVPHRALLSHCIAIAAEYELHANDRTLQFASISFDVAVEEMFPSWLSGATVVLHSDRVPPSIPDFLKFVEQQKLTVVNLPVSYWHEWVSEISRSGPALPDSLRLVVVGNEKASPERFVTWQRTIGDRVDWRNAYGPTEATITATIYQPPAFDNQHVVDSVPIGRPIANKQVYILDSHLQPTPIGVPGELHIAGDGLARGYLNRPEITAEKFIPNPFSSYGAKACEVPGGAAPLGCSAWPEVSGARLYKTGDRARYLPDGNIEFLGRIDLQVKVRGYRIELGEIESVLSEHPAVIESVVVAREDEPGDKRLVAYLVGRESETPGISELRSYLKEKLPEYMIPSAFVVLERLPLSPNGKVDRRGLPAPERSRLELEGRYQASRTPIEEMLAVIWAGILGLEQVGIHDNFFELGGHSLIATRIISRVREAFQLELPLRALFESPTIAELAERVEAARQADSGLQMLPLQRVSRDGRLPLSFAQQRLWFLDQLEPDNPSYNVPQALRLKGVLEINALEQTINAIIARHESLRTTFKAIDKQPVQIVSAVHEIKLAFTDLKELPEAEREAEARRLATAEARRPFDLNRDYPLRAALVRIENDDHFLLLTMHHIVSDGWSMGVLTRELSTIYDAIAANQPIELAELPVQYADFAEWQREWLQGGVLEEQLAYWRKSLAGAPAMLNLQTDHPRPAVQSFRGANLSYTLSEKLSRSLKEFSQREGATLFMTLLAAFQTLLFRYTGEEDIVVGTPTAGRNRVEIESLIGFFVNTLALRTKLSGNPTFRQLLGRVKDVALGAYAHQDLPFEKLVEELNPERDVGHTPVFQVMFGVQNAPREKLALSRLTITRVPTMSETAKFDLTLFVGEAAHGLSCWLEYNTDLFEQKTVERMVGHFEVLLEGIVADPSQRLAELPLLRETERQQLLSEWNDTRVEFPNKDCLHQLFEAQAEKTPDAIALACGDEVLTYSELNTRANQLAHHLQRLGIGPEDRVGICLRRTSAMLIAILGTLKAGGSYMPLDPAYPRERLGFILQDAGAAVLLTQNELAPMLPQTDSRVVSLDSDWQVIAREDQSNPVSTVTPQNLGCVMYTSGSTGVPKGVSILHSSTVTFLHWAISSFDKQDLAAVLASTSICFDLSVFEMFAPLCSGGKVVLVESALHLRDLAAADVTLVNTVPSAMAELVRLRDIPPSVRTINLAGEPLANSLVQEIYQQDSVRQVLNLYGPSEDTTYSTFVRVPKGATEEPSIGRPIANTQVYLLDRFSQLVPVGIPGELHLGGAGLARGYLNRASLTAEKFVPNPFSSEPGARLYKTGDLARYQPDGTVQFLGRMDHQVKLRGYRIELGEIEATIREHAAVQDAVVMVRDSAEGNKTLVGYVVVDSNDSALQDDKLAAELKSFLKKKLPDYMVPASFVELDQLPLTPNGKIDRKALPEPGPRPTDSSIFSRPRNEIEFALTLIWERVLNVRPIGLADNFFELGGHSLLAVRLMAEIEEEIGQRIPLVSLFQSATIEGLAGILQQGVSSISWPIVVELQRGGSRPPLFCVSLPGVNALGYRFLAHSLEPDQPVYGLQAQYPEDLRGEHSNTAVDELATEYLEAIRAVQPHGPYQLAGMCRGAHIAFEMARRLENQGESVALVGIFDTWVMENTYNRLLFLGGYYFRRLTSLLRLALKLGFIKEKARTANGNAGDTAPAPPENSAANQKNPMYEVYFPGPDFAPKTYPGRVTVFRTKRQPLNRIRDPQLGWGRLAGGVVDVHIIPGKHGNLLREPNVQGLAEELKKCLLEK